MVEFHHGLRYVVMAVPLASLLYWSFVVNPADVLKRRFDGVRVLLMWLVELKRETVSSVLRVVSDDDYFLAA